jgi:hypothetical protein
MANLTYGTPEFYKEQFSDLLADVEAGDPMISENILKGFYLAIEDWFEYHDKQAREYAAIRKRVRSTLGM